MNAARLPGLVVILGLMVAGVLVDRQRVPAADSAEQLLLAVPAASPPSDRSSTWFCTASTGQEGLADGLVTISNLAPEPRSAVVSAFEGGVEPIVGSPGTEAIIDIAPLSSQDIRLSDLLPDAAVVSLAVEVDGGGVVVEKVVSGATGVGRSSCATEGATSWIIPNGTIGPGAALHLFVFNPFPDDAVVDIEFVTENGVRSPEELVGLHVPARSSRLLSVGDVVAAAETASTFLDARSGRVLLEAIQSFDGSEDPIGLSALPAGAGTASEWTFAGVSPQIGPARLVVVNPGDEAVRADVQVYPAGAERFIEPFELTLRPGQQAIVELNDEGRLAGIDTFSLLVRSFDGPSIVAGIEQRPSVEEDDPLDAFREEVVAPSTGFAASVGQPIAATTVYATIEGQEDDKRSAIHLFNPADDSFVTATMTVVAEGASRSFDVEIGPQRTTTLLLSDIAIGRAAVRVEASAPIIGAREITGLSSRSWSALLPEIARG